MTIQLRNRIYSLRVRVPARYRHLHRSSHVWRSLGTDSEEQAERRAPEVREQLLAEWAARAGAAVNETPAERYRRISDLAAARGYIYQTSEELADGPLDRAAQRIVERIEAATPRASKETMEALLGGVERPAILVSSLPALVEEHEAVALAAMSKEQRRVKFGGYRRCARLYVEHVGDCPITEVDRYGALMLRDALQERVLSAEENNRIKADTANKYMHGLAAMLSKLLLKHKLPDSRPFSGIMLPTDGKAQRLPFDDAWIVEHILSPAALANAGDEMRDLAIVMALTGARPSELTDVLPHHIHIDHSVPHLWIKPEGRKLKTAASERPLVLVGAALEAIRRHPEGFPGYRGRPTSFSGAINKHLRAHDLMPTEDHTVYGLRHSFEDRMLKKKFPDRLAAELMGHTVQRERYGAGPDLEMRLKAMRRLDITPR